MEPDMTGNKILIESDVFSLLLHNSLVRASNGRVRGISGAINPQTQCVGGPQNYYNPFR